MKKLHMLIIAACAVAFAAPAQAHGMHHMMGPHGMMGGACMQKLPSDKQKISEDAMHDMMQKNKPLMERMGKLHERMRAIGTADKFDRRAFTAAGDDMAMLHMKMEKNRTSMMASVAEKLTSSERRMIADCMEKNFHRGDAGHGGWKHEGGLSKEDSHNDYGGVNQ